MTTDELIARVWGDIRERERWLAEDPPVDARILMEAADEIAKRRADEAVRWLGRRKGEGGGDDVL